jgi:hypothetical protein
VSHEPCKCFYCQYKQPEAPAIRMQPRDETAHQFALRKAHELIDLEEPQIGDASDGCGESPDGEDE